MAKHDNKYKPEYAKMLPDMFANGEDVAEVAVELGISRQTFYVWVRKHPEFKEAYEMGKLRSEAWWCKLGREGSEGARNIQPAVWVFNMKNKFDWNDKQSHEITGRDGGPIETSTNINMSKLSDEEIEALMSITDKLQE
jgi:transposase